MGKVITDEDLDKFLTWLDAPPLLEWQRSMLKVAISRERTMLCLPWPRHYGRTRALMLADLFNRCMVEDFINKEKKDEENH